ncbi:MAG: YebC/PmpR family DNA-binding transcriptional regulator [Gammaproteobacteria bacterium]|nr:YebC/PmpR family DNA-binding transcriptional regulator [Gammaproteobacteria bacterium]
MAGHSKWANIKHRKARQDSKRQKIYGKLIREITVAARLGGGSAEDNPRLRTVLVKATGANIPKDTIDRAIARGASGLEGETYEEVTFEGYGPSGVAILVQALTDNRNRTVAAIRHAFSKHGGNLGTDGSVSYLFARRGLIPFAPGVDEDALFEAALEVGADDVESNEDGSMCVVTDEATFADVVEGLAHHGLESSDAELAMVPSTTTPLGETDAEKALRLIDALEDLDDVQEVHSNLEVN